MQKICTVEHSAWRQMKENYQIYLPIQFCPRVQSLDRVPRLSQKKMKTLFLWNMSKTDFDFFPDNQLRAGILLKAFLKSD